MYAIVRSGGTQQRVSVGDVIDVDRLGDDASPESAVGAEVAFPAVLVVDGEAVTSDAAALADVRVTAEVVGASTGPKIRIFTYKNKTGYRRRKGHRQKYTRVRITGVTGLTSQTTS